jgi:predicted PurR-regulated permease PerM
MDRIADFFAQRTARRILTLSLFVGLLYLFRHLAILLLFFVTFERALGFCARTLAARTGIPRKKCLLLTLLTIVVGVTVVAWFGIGKTVRTFTAMQQTFPDKLAKIREMPIVDKLEDQFGGMDKLVDTAKHYAGDAISAANEVGHFVLYVLMGFILAIVWSLEEEELHHFWSRVERGSIVGTIGHWLKHVADATVVTVQLQFIVAACNTMMTLPVLLVIGVPNVGGLMLLIFVSALVPVIGNIVSGVTLALLAYQVKGWVGVGIFAALTFVLHKIESYYLSPRLTARHVKMPGFLLIVSLILCEHIFGFKGLFLSFPILFVAGRIRTDWVEEEHGSAASVIDHLDEAAKPAPISATGVELEFQSRHPPLDGAEDEKMSDRPPSRPTAEDT